MDSKWLSGIYSYPSSPDQTKARDFEILNVSDYRVFVDGEPVATEIPVFCYSDLDDYKKLLRNLLEYESNRPYGGFLIVRETEPKHTVVKEGNRNLIASLLEYGYENFTIEEIFGLWHI